MKPTAHTDKSLWRLPADFAVGIISIVVVPVIVLIIGADVVARYVFSAPIFWAQEVSTLLLLLLFFCGQPACIRYGEHVRMELLYQHFSPFWRNIVDSISALMGILIASTIGYRIWNEMWSPFSSGDTHGFMKFPVLPIRVILLVVLALVVLESIRRLSAIWKD